MVAGGNGSLEAARRLAAEGITVAFVPATIDNDVAGTDRSIGHDSALAYALGVIEQLRITGRSVPERGFVVQTLGGGTRAARRGRRGRGGHRRRDRARRTARTWSRSRAGSPRTSPTAKRWP